MKLPKVTVTKGTLGAGLVLALAVPFINKHIVQPLLDKSGKPLLDRFM